MSNSITDRADAGVESARESFPAAVAPEPRMLAARLAAACLFWMLCLTLTAAGHRLYKATVAVDRKVSAECYRSDGAPLVWVGHGNVENAVKRIAPNTHPVPAGQLSVLPNSPFLLSAAAAFTSLAALMAWSGRWINGHGIASLVGLFAGHFLWLGAIEFGLAAVGRRLGLAGSLELIDGRVVGTHGGGILIQMSAVFLVPVVIGLTMHESNRCAVFQWFRRRLPIAKTAAASGRVENYAARTTIQYFMTVWFCYVSVLWLADSRLGSAGQTGLLVTLGLIALATPYMIWRTACQSTCGGALRYSVSGAVVAWTGIEIAAAMRFFHEPWLSNSVSSGIVWFGLSILLAVIAGLMLRTSHPLLAQPRVGATFGLIAIVLGIAGCGQTDNSQDSAAEIERQIREYDAQIQRPDSGARDGLLHALASPDPAIRAQAALAFGKSDKVDTAVVKRLRAIASNDDSRLPQFAALAALHRLGSLPPDLHDLLRQFAADPKWKPVVDYVSN